MKKLRTFLFAGAFVLAVTSAFATRALYEDHGTYIDDYYNCIAAPLVQNPNYCNPNNTGPQCTVWGYTATGIDQFPAYVYNRPYANCITPLYHAF